MARQSLNRHGDARILKDLGHGWLGELPGLLQLLLALWGSGILCRPDFQPFPHGTAQLSLQLHLMEPVRSPSFPTWSPIQKLTVQSAECVAGFVEIYSLAPHQVVHEFSIECFKI